MTGPERCQHLPAKRYECTMCLHSALTAAREEIARLEALHHAKCLETGAEIARLRAFHDKHEACIDALTDDYHKSVEQTLNRADQAEQRVRELEADLKHRCERHPNSIDVVLCSACDDERHTDAECQSENLEQRLAESQAALESTARDAIKAQDALKESQAALRRFKDWADHWCEDNGTARAFKATDQYQQMEAALTPKPAAGAYDKAFGDERLCACGHTYYRHFDSYDRMYPVGCKHCPCHTWTAAGGEGAT